MRIFPIITAILVIVTLYLLVFERQRIVDFATGNDAVMTDEIAADEMPTPAEMADEDAETRVSVVIMASQAQEIASAVLVRGQTEAARQVDVRAETAGQVISEPLRKGTEISTGQLLCEIDPGTREISLAEANARLAEAQARVLEAESRPSEAQARIAEAQARVVEAEINLTAAERLSQGGFASDTRVASAKAAHESATAAVQAALSGLASSQSGIQSAIAGVQSAQAGAAAATREIGKLEITAPFGGLLESDAAEIGTFLQPGALCATVIQLNPIKLVGFVPETDVGRIKIGAPAGARLINGDEVRGKVTFLSRSADSTTRTFRVEIQVPNDTLEIRDGQTAEIIISSAGKAAHLIPSSALTLNNKGDLGVRSVDASNTVRFINVSILRDTVQGIWVAGLPDLVDVIIVGQEYVIDGVLVDASYKETSQ
ncbi:MAG: efflux RND transporter periplasmic adaptor subunit [Paracoccaceae bacterium]